MNLHSDRAAFELIIDEVANSSDIRRDVRKEPGLIIGKMIRRILKCVFEYV